MVPDPVAFWERAEEWDEEGKVFFDQKGDLMLREGQSGSLSG